MNEFPVFYLPDNQEVLADPKHSILHNSLAFNIPHTSVCGGKGRCSTCRIVILNGLEFCSPRSAAEQILATRLSFNNNTRLACQTYIHGPIQLRRMVIDEDDICVTKLLNRENEITSIGEEKQVAIMFADIRDFTSLSEKLPPYDVIHILNRYFNTMHKIISQHDGYIDNYMGDGLLAIFGTQNSSAAAQHAVQAALAMLEAIPRLNIYLQNLYQQEIKIGIGIHYGDVVIGSLGVADYQKKTVIGDNVNLASRVEAANKEIGSSILVTDAVYRQIEGQFEIRQCFHTKIRGKSGEYILCEIISSNI